MSALLPSRPTAAHGLTDKKSEEECQHRSLEQIIGACFTEMEHRNAEARNQVRDVPAPLPLPALVSERLARPRYTALRGAGTGVSASAARYVAPVALFHGPPFAVTGHVVPAAEAVERRALCVVCETRPVNVCVNPCGHPYMCHECAVTMRTSSNLATCAICRVRIESVIPYRRVAVRLDAPQTATPRRNASAIAIANASANANADANTKRRRIVIDVDSLPERKVAGAQAGTADDAATVAAIDRAITTALADVAKKH